MEINNAANQFVSALYKERNPNPKFNFDGVDVSYYLKNTSLNASQVHSIEAHIKSILPIEINYYLATTLFPQYTDMLTYQKQIVPDYYDCNKENKHYELSDYNDFQNFSFRAFWDKSTPVNHHLFQSIYRFNEVFVNNILGKLENRSVGSEDQNIRYMLHTLSKHCERFINSLQLEDIFALYQLPEELKKLEICNKRSCYFNRYIGQKQELNKVFEALLKDTDDFEKTLVFVSGTSITRMSTEHIKNALRRKRSPIEAIQAHLRIDPLLLYEMNDYLSVIVIEPTHLKMKCDRVKIYKGFTLDKVSGLFSINPDNLKNGLKRVKNHWIFRYFEI